MQSIIVTKKNLKIAPAPCFWKAGGSGSGQVFGNVTYRVRFKNRSHFSTSFKKYFGYAPGSVIAI